jgi:chemotaxis protein methyltransferase CheR
MVTQHAEASASISSLLLEQLGRFVESRLGLHLPKSQSADLERGIRSAADEFGFDDVSKCIEWVLSSELSKSQIEVIAGHLTIGETYFFRDRRVFEILESVVFPEITASRRGKEKILRIWSAGCATGEEPYSIAMTVTKVFPDCKEWEIGILATDIVPSSLKRASEGIYNEWSFRETPSWIKQGCFEKVKGKYRIAPRFRQMVTFASLNLAEDPYPAIITNTNAIDIIFCRNVLMYFSRDKARKVVDNLAHCLVDGGWLIISPIESPDADYSSFLQPVRFPGAILYKKKEHRRKEEVRATALALLQTKGKKQTPRKIAEHPVKRVEWPPSIQPVKNLPVDLDSQTTHQVRFLANGGKLPEALALCENILRKDKLNPILYYLHATILLEMGRANEAEVSLQRALYLDQEFAIAHFSLGHLLQSRNKIKEAAKHLQKARSLLSVFRQEAVPPESEGMTAGRLIEVIDAMEIVLNRRRLHE